MGELQKIYDRLSALGRILHTKIDRMYEPVNEAFFNAAFEGRLADNKKFIPVSNERSLELMEEALTFHEEVYLPAEAEMEKQLGRGLNWGEMMMLNLTLRFK